MAATSQERVNEARRIAAIIEPCALASWPARENLRDKGWVLRFTNGYSHRGSSVAVLDDDATNLAARIDAAERAYMQHGLVPQFQLTPLAPPVLKEALLGRGYTAISPTMVCAADVETVCAPGVDIGRVDMLQSANAAFDRLVVSGSHSKDDGDERLEILNRLAHPHIRAQAFDNGLPVACGVAVNVQGSAGIYVMRTAATYRRRGHASRVLAALARWAKMQGAILLYLQVEENNAPARTLYARAGFRDAYPYRYYVKPQTGT